MENEKKLFSHFLTIGGCYGNHAMSDVCHGNQTRVFLSARHFISNYEFRSGAHGSLLVYIKSIWFYDFIFTSSQTLKTTFLKTFFVVFRIVIVEKSEWTDEQESKQTKKQTM